VPEHDTAPLLEELDSRGLLAQCSDEAIGERLSSPVTAYIGFDPTADSLHVGSLVPIIGLAWLRRCGHQPQAVLGGATALVGDPSGKSSMRQMLTPEIVRSNGAAVGRQITSILDRAAPEGAALQVLDNADWLADRGWIDLLREIGPHFSVNRMLSMDSVRSRMESGSGISFLEFNYMVMQAVDFLHLHREHGCSLQMGGQDQWGNIVMGIELVRRIADSSVAGLTMPLVTKADGGKFGKSEQGNIWLSPERTSVFEFYQFWRNVADADTARYLAYFTFLPHDELARLQALEGAESNQAKEVLAFEVTRLVHGEAEARRAQQDARRAFGAEDVAGESIHHARLPAQELEAGIGILTLLVRAELARSNSEARRLVQGGGVRLHDQRIDEPGYTVGSGDIADGRVLLRAGKKRLFRFDIA